MKTGFFLLRSHPTDSNFLFRKKFGATPLKPSADTLIVEGKV